jgi:TM2 domain-containing membrane protein YozV
MKNKYIAAALALFFGYFGLQKFYLGKTAKGIISILFCWTFIPYIFSIIEGIQLLLMPQDLFDFKYNYSGESRILEKERIEVEREKLKIQKLRLERERIEAERRLIQFKNTQPNEGQADELAAWSSLLEQGLISKQEFEEKKKILLGLDE